MLPFGKNHLPNIIINIKDISRVTAVESCVNLIGI